MTSIFTLAEARAFRHQGQTPLASATAYSDDLVQDAADRITEDFARICDVSFVPVTVTDEVLDVGGGWRARTLLLPHPRVTAVSAASYRAAGVTTWTDLTADDLASLVIEPGGGVYWPSGYWPWGPGRAKVSYTHGYAAPPAAIVRAALILAVEDLAGSNISDRATQQTNENGTFNLAVPGWRDGQWYGVPVVDSVLQRYSERGPAVG